jgi:transposase-like protein
MQQTRTKEEKQELIQLYKQSGMSVRAFAEEFNLNLATFRNWLYKKQPEPKPADDNLNFVEVKATQEIKFSGRQDIRIQKNGIEISIPVNAGLPVLERILGAVSAI